MNQREYLAHVQNLCVNLDGNFLLYMEENQGYLYALNKYSIKWLQIYICSNNWLHIEKFRWTIKPLETSKLN